MMNSAFTFKSLVLAWRATEAARPMSWYEEFVQEPTRPTSICCGIPFSRTKAPNSEIVCAASGVNGPLI